MQVTTNAWVNEPCTGERLPDAIEGHKTNSHRSQQPRGAPRARSQGKVHGSAIPTEEQLLYDLSHDLALAARFLASSLADTWQAFLRPLFPKQSGHTSCPSQPAPRKTSTHMANPPGSWP